MPYANSNDLTEKEFYAGVSRLMDTKPQTIKKYWEGIYEFIIRELFFKGSCRVPMMGNFSLKRIGESIQVQIDQNGKQVTYRIPERDIPIFTPHDTMKNDVNMQGVTKAYRKRLKNGVLTQRDYLRQVRAEALNVSGSLSEERINQAKKDFKELLNQKKLEKEKVRKEELNSDDET